MVTGSIVLYNNDVDILKEAINSFLNYEKAVVLYLIDNSPNDNLRLLEKLDDRILYISNPTNPGFGAAHNIAIRQAKILNSRYHLVLNPDIYFDKNVIPEIVEFMKSNLDIGNVMPKVLYPDGSLQYLCKLLPTPYDWIGRRFNPLKKMVNRRNQIFELRFTEYNSIMEVPYLSGCFMFLNMNILDEVGLFDEKIFMYGEETDLCRRVIDKGFRTVFYPYVSIHHHFAKGSHKSWHLTKIGMQSAVYYFNKWGWFFDRRRSKINKGALDKLKKNL